MSKYTVRKVKTFLGHEGHGFNAELLRDGVPVAFVIDDANGGEPRFDWYDRTYALVKLERTDGGNPVTLKIPVEAAALHEHIKGHTRTAYGETFPLSMDLFVGELVDDHKMAAATKRRCKSSTCYRLVGQEPGEYMQTTVKYSKEIGDKLRAKYGDKLECIYNEQNLEA